MAAERIDLRDFLSDSLDLLGELIPDEVVFTCRFGETPEVWAEALQLRAALAKLVMGVCDGPGEVELRTGQVPGRSGPHAFVEVRRLDAAARMILPIPAYRPAQVRLADPEPATVH